MFIQVMQGEIKDVEAVRETMNRWREEVGPAAEGYIGGTFGVADDGQLVAVVRFDSEEAARRNSDRPEQGAWWSDMSAHFVGDVEFHDYPEVVTLLEGGSDDAGFVQIIQGRIADPGRFRDMVETAGQTLRTSRPDVIGATIGVAPDGHFTQTVAFASESAARVGETQDMSEDAHEYMAALQDVSFIDLRDPWFETH